MIDLPNPRAGEPIRAEHILALAEAIEDLRGGADAAYTDPDNNAVIKAQASSGSVTLVPVRIFAVNAPNGDDQLNTPSQVTYHIRGIGKKGIDINPMTPWYGRPVRNDEAKIYPAREGSIAFIVRSPAADGNGGTEGRLMLLPGDECLSYAPCTQ